MTWTNDLPTKAGWYWWRESSDCPSVVIELWIPYKSREVIITSLETHGDFLLLKEVSDTHPSCQWSSTPIPEPEEKQ